MKSSEFSVPPCKTRLPPYQITTEIMLAPIVSDRIIVLEDGKIVDEGTNEELQQRSGRYRQLYELQFNT